MATAEQIQFTQTAIVPGAKQLVETYYAAKRTLDEWSAKGMAVTIAADKAVILKGDGGVELTGAEIHSHIASLTEFVASVEAKDKSALNAAIRAGSGRA